MTTNSIKVTYVDSGRLTVKEKAAQFFKVKLCSRISVCTVWKIQGRMVIPSFAVPFGSVFILAH